MAAADPSLALTMRLLRLLLLLFVVVAAATRASFIERVLDHACGGGRTLVFMSDDEMSTAVAQTRRCIRALTVLLGRHAVNSAERRVGVAGVGRDVTILLPYSFPTADARSAFKRRVEAREPRSFAGPPETPIDDHAGNATGHIVFFHWTWPPRVAWVNYYHDVGLRLVDSAVTMGYFPTEGLWFE
jgi:hypothetical protein